MEFEARISRAPPQNTHSAPYMHTTLPTTQQSCPTRTTQQHKLDPLKQDVADLTDFGIPQNVDFIAASFVRKGEDIDHIRHVLGDAGAHIKVGIWRGWDGRKESLLCSLCVFYTDTRNPPPHTHHHKPKRSN